MHLGSIVAPYLPCLFDVKRIGSRDYEDALVGQVFSQVAEELTGVVKVFDDIAGNDGLEFFTELHGYDIGYFDLVIQTTQYIDAFAIDIDAEHIVIEFSDGSVKRRGSLDGQPSCRSVFLRSAVHHTEVQGLAACHQGADYFHSILDTVFEG